MIDGIYDAIVIGGGPGGYVAAIRLAQLKQQVLLVEKKSLGGVCLNWGCIPSKALITASSLIDKIREVQSIGITVTDLRFDLPKMQAWKDSIIKKLTQGVHSLVTSNGGTIAFGTAKLIGPQTVQVTEPNHGMKTYRADKGIIIATGARPIQLPGFEVDGRTVLSAKDAINLKKVPESLLVVGGGAIGLEIGMTYQKLGTNVMILEVENQLLPGFDQDIVHVVERRFKKKGGKVLLEVRAKCCEVIDNRAKVTVEHEGKTREIECDKVLIAVGFHPNTEDIGLEELGIKKGAQGQLVTDKKLKTNLLNIYAIGDVVGPPYLAHKASKEGEIAAELISGKNSEYDALAIPFAIYCDPEIAVVGLSETEAKHQGRKIKVGKFPFSASGRAMTLSDTDGFVKTIIDGEEGQVLGVGIVGPEAANLIGEATLGIEMCAMAEDIARTIHPHPTLSESMMESCMHSIGEAIHILNRR